MRKRAKQPSIIAGRSAYRFVAFATAILLLPPSAHWTQQHCFQPPTIISILYHQAVLVRQILLLNRLL